MSSAQQDGVELANGFYFTDHMDAPCRLAYGHNKTVYSDVYACNIDGSEPQELLAGHTRTLQTTLCFSRDGRTLYGHDTGFWAKDALTGTTQTLPDIPQAPGFEQTLILECSPDNHTLLVEQTAPLQPTRQGSPPAPSRLCLISTQGMEFRVLFTFSAEASPRGVACCWKQQFVLLCRFVRIGSGSGYELCRLDMNSGRLTVLSSLPNWGWENALRPDGMKVVWSHSDGFRTAPELYTYSLVDGVTRLIPAAGTCPAWSPDGRYIAYMEDEYKLCLWDTQHGCAQPLVWFTPPSLTHTERAGSYAVEPVWSPDGHMLWFALTQTRRLPAPHTLSQLATRAGYYIRPILYNLNPKRTSTHVGFRACYAIHKIGVVDLTTRQVLLSDGYDYGAAWLPRPGK